MAIATDIAPQPNVRLLIVEQRLDLCHALADSGK
jgi:hypothetical protein